MTFTAVVHIVGPLEKNDLFIIIDFAIFTIISIKYYEARKNCFVFLLSKKHMHAVVDDLINCLIRHPKICSQFHRSKFQVSQSRPLLLLGQCMQKSDEAACHCIFKRLPKSCRKSRIFVCFAIVKAHFGGSTRSTTKAHFKKK